jgi:hypothetical protein
MTSPFPMAAGGGGRAMARRPVPMEVGEDQVVYGSTSRVAADDATI